MAPAGEWYIAADAPTLLPRGSVAAYERDATPSKRRAIFDSEQRGRQEPAPEPQGPPACARSQVLRIADIISNLERRSEWLEGRTSGLTQKLLQNQRVVLERCFVDRSRGILRGHFEGWQRATRELARENELEQANQNLQESQTIAQDLGDQLARDRQAREAAEAGSEAIAQEVERKTADSALLREQAETAANRLRLLELQLQSVEAALHRGKVDGDGMAGTANAYQRWSRGLQREADAEAEANPVEEGARLVGQADGVMKQLHSVLSQDGSRASSSRGIHHQVPTDASPPSSSPSRRRAAPPQQVPYAATLAPYRGGADSPVVPPRQAQALALYEVQAAPRGVAFSPPVPRRNAPALVPAEVGARTPPMGRR